MNTKRIGKLATVAASAALTLQLFAGASAAAVPNGSRRRAVVRNVGAATGGRRSRPLRLRTDSSTLSKLYLEIDIDNGASVSLFAATKNGNPVNGL